MRSMREVLSDFSEMGARHNFLMNSGRECDGWIVSVEDDHILFVDSSPGAGKDEIKIRFAAIDVGSLAYRDDEKRCWMSARWNDSQSQWNHSILSLDEDPEEVLKQAEKPSKLGKIKQLWRPERPAAQISSINAASSLASPFQS